MVISSFILFFRGVGVGGTLQTFDNQHSQLMVENWKQYNPYVITQTQ
jgi:hypothetical protein